MKSAESTKLASLRPQAIRVSRLINSPLRVGVTSLVLAAIFAFIRTVIAGHGHIGSLVLAGSDHINANRTPKGLPYVVGQGYDGQFYYRMALDPFNFSKTFHGITIDTIARFQRIVYPFVVWVLSLGSHLLTPYMMVAVNIVGIGVIGFLGAVIASRANRDPLFGLAFSGFFGFVMSLSRDLTEITEAAFLLAGLLAYLSHRSVLAGIFLALAVLSKEPTVIVVAGLGLSEIAAQLLPRFFAPNNSGIGDPSVPVNLRKRNAWSRNAIWLIPLLTFSAWQFVIREQTGRIPILSVSGHNAGVPLVGFVQGLQNYFSSISSPTTILWLLELVLLVYIGVLAFVHFRDSTAPNALKWALIILSISILFYQKIVWVGAADFRMLDDFYLIALIIALFSKVKFNAYNLFLSALTGLALLQGMLRLD